MCLTLSSLIVDCEVVDLKVGRLEAGPSCHIQMLA